MSRFFGGTARYFVQRGGIENSWGGRSRERIGEGGRPSVDGVRKRGERWKLFLSLPALPPLAGLSHEEG